MNFGQNLYNWFLSNAQSLVLMAIVVIGIYLGFKREFSKLIGFLVVALVAVGSKVTGIPPCQKFCNSETAIRNVGDCFLLVISAFAPDAARCYPRS